MNSRPKQPKYARNKNVVVIGGSGSGKTRFFVKPNLMQLHSSYVLTDPKGTVLIECGKLLQRAGYRIKVLNTINFRKSMHYNPFVYIRSEKDVLKVVNTLIVNTKGEGEKSAEDFWVKAERLLYCALIGYIWYEAPAEEMNFTTLLELINASEAREDDEEYQSPVDLLFADLEERSPDHFAEKQYKKYKLAAGFSGVSFEREGLQAMLQEVEAGRVATVITKDLSRLGRNYLKTGELIEIVFPENGVRYIAINDGVDTAREDNEFTPLRNWFNEFYARDTSKKIRAVKQAQAQKGERVNGEYPYGYIPDPNNRHHLIPDPETAPIVKQVFAMFVSGVRMCEIQKWLAENKVLTIGALRYQRTGQAQYQRAMIAPYTWPDKTLYDILARQEYLGHTITAKTHKVSYKSKKTRKNEEEQRYFFPNTHEPLVDEETFELAQKRIATRHRPTKAAEIDIFSGLLFCAGCGHKMYYQQGVNIEPRRFSYSCGAWRNRARTGSECTSHYIRKNVLLDLVLEDMRRVLRYVKEHEQDFICKATEYGDMEARKALAQQQKELFKAQARMTALATLFRKLYEDNALGRLTDERFVFLTSGYEDEKKSLAARIDELQQQIATVTERKRDISRFIQIVGKYSDIQELTYENVHEFIDRILIHELDRETNTRKIEIHYSFVGQVDTEQEPTQVVNHDRRNMVDVKSIAI